MQQIYIDILSFIIGSGGALGLLIFIWKRMNGLKQENDKLQEEKHKLETKQEILNYSNALNELKIELKTVISTVNNLSGMNEEVKRDLQRELKEINKSMTEIKEFVSNQKITNNGMKSDIEDLYSKLTEIKTEVKKLMDGQHQMDKNINLLISDRGLSE